MKRQKIVDIINEDASSVEVMTECLNQFHRFDLVNATLEQKSKFYMAVKRFVSLIKVEPSPKRT